MRATMNVNVCSSKVRSAVPVCRSRAVSVKVAAQMTAVMEPQVETTTEKKGMTRAEAAALNLRMQAKAKALISLEEMQVPNRPKVRITLRNRVGLGEVWKIVGTCPELGRMSPEIAPSMRWTEGDVWVLETPMRQGEHTYKAVLRRADGAYIWEAGEDRTMKISPELTNEDTISVELDSKLPW